MSKPFALVQIDDTVRHLRNTMRKADHHIPKSMAQQLPGIVSFWLRARLRGDADIHPGHKKMAKWGQCSERQSGENYRRLKLYGVCFVTSYGKGGRRAPRFRVSMNGIVRYLITVGANPSPELIGKLRYYDEKVEVKVEVEGAEKVAEKLEATSTGIHIEEDTFGMDGKVVFFPIRQAAGGGA